MSEHERACPVCLTAVEIAEPDKPSLDPVPYCATCGRLTGWAVLRDEPEPCVVALAWAAGGHDLFEQGIPFAEWARRVKPSLFRWDRGIGRAISDEAASEFEEAVLTARARDAHALACARVQRAASKRRASAEFEAKVRRARARRKGKAARPRRRRSPSILLSSPFIVRPAVAA